MISDNGILRPDWPLSGLVQAMCTTRKGGVSKAPWASLNLGAHVGDNPESVAENRQRLARYTGLEASRIGWLNQVHGTRVVELTPENAQQVPEGDASFTRSSCLACAILTADCLPVVLADSGGTVVGAAHAGWRSLSGGVLENLVRAMAVEPGRLVAWLGPAIGPDSFEVGPEVREVFVRHNPEASNAFKAKGARPGHFMADIYSLATLRLRQAGVASITGGSLCTVQDKEWFFSYRRDGQTGRMATLVWLKY